MKISGNTIFIPGATSGIGRGFAERFADAGNKVIVAGRRPQLIEEITSSHHNIEGFVLDVVDAQLIDGAVSMIRMRFPDTNVLMPVTGIQLPEDVHTAAFLATAEATVATNLLEPIS